MRSLSVRGPFFKFSLFALLILFAALSRAQDQASITGVVSDSSGAVVSGASVVLENPSTSSTYKTVTNGDGSYTFANVTPGPGYKITFSASGFKSVVITGVYLNVTSTRTQNAKLAVGSTSQTIEVSASSEGVTLNTTDATIGNSFQVQMLNNLPVQNRDSPAALFYQQPGVTLGGAVTGARSDQSNVTLDGLEVNDNATGQFGDIVGEAPVDSVQEFRGVTADPLSSSGQGGGGQFELVTKSGTNNFHGDVNEYHRDTDTEANDWFNNNAGVGRPPLVRNQFGGQIGGPIWRDRAYFFFDFDGRRDARSALVDRTVPIGTNTSGYRGGQLSYINSDGDTVTMPNTGGSQSVSGFDPQGIGWNQAELALFQKRYPVANDLTGDVGDGVNTAGFRFNAPDPFNENVYVQRLDYTINDKMKLSGRATVAQRSTIESAIQFPGDPTFTFPFYDRTYGWIVEHTWTINDHMLNRASFGENKEDFNFSVTYNPQGANVFAYAGLSGPYAAGNNSQARTYPIPVVRDDFSWEKGRHSFAFGGTFKWETPNEFAAENYNFQNVGVTGNTDFTALSPNLRPSDISTSDFATTIYDNAFSTALGAFASTGANFDYNNKAVVQPQGSGLDLVYRNYETEVYFGDSWKVTPDLTVTYGVRYQNYTVPYEIHGAEGVPEMTTGGTVSPFGFDQYWAAREKQSTAGIASNTAIPFIQYVYGGKVNHGPDYYQPQKDLFSPHVAFAYNPGFDKKTVISGGASIVYDHAIINALQFLQLQSSGLFESMSTNLYGTAGDPTASLSSSSPATGGTPRFSGISTAPAPPTAPNVSSPYAPFVANIPGLGPYPYGLPEGQFNIAIDPKLKNPYNIEYDFGIQHEFPQGYILKIDYAGRLGRRLLAEADASQLVEFPDNTGKSNQTMSQAMGALTTQLRQHANLGALGAILSVSPQPWFEDVITPGVGVANGFASNTQMIAYDAYPYPQRGDFADAMYILSTIGFPFQSILPSNVAMASQFADNTVWTNKGSSSYNGLLVTLHKNAGYGLQFDLNYTWAHSIDNVSAVADFIAGNSGFGYICDVQRPRECRGNSDFDASNYLSGNFIYELPFGHGKAIAATAPFWLNEVIGGWDLSGIPGWHTGNAYSASSNAFVASFANNAPATLLGPVGIANTRIHGGNGQALNAFQNPAATLKAFTGPTGFNIGQRNILRGPGYFNLDLGLGKTFPIWEDKVNLKFRCDAFNALNHPNFNNPNTDITQSSGVSFGTISSTYVPPGSDLAVRVLQGALRLEF